MTHSVLSESSLPDYIRPYSSQLKGIKSLTLLFELAAWPGSTDKRLPTISFVIFSVFCTLSTFSIFVSSQ